MDNFHVGALFGSKEIACGQRVATVTHQDFELEEKKFSWPYFFSCGTDIVEKYKKKKSSFQKRRPALAFEKWL